jgi:hypothetical protein
MVEEVSRAAATNSQVREAILPGGRGVPTAAAELLARAADLTTYLAAPVSADDDIPF